MTGAAWFGWGVASGILAFLASVLSVVYFLVRLEKAAAEEIARRGLTPGCSQSRRAPSHTFVAKSYGLGGTLKPDGSERARDAELLEAQEAKRAQWRREIDDLGRRP